LFLKLDNAVNMCRLREQPFYPPLSMQLCKDTNKKSKVHDLTQEKCIILCLWYFCRQDPIKKESRGQTWSNPL